jgi:hypothetical protein
MTVARCVLPEENMAAVCVPPILTVVTVAVVQEVTTVVFCVGPAVFILVVTVSTITEQLFVLIFADTPTTTFTSGPGCE